MTGAQTETEALELRDIMDQVVLSDIYRIFHPNTIEYTFLKKKAQGNFFKICHISEHKPIVKELQKIYKFMEIK